MRSFRMCKRQLMLASRKTATALLAVVMCLSLSFPVVPAFGANDSPSSPANQAGATAQRSAAAARGASEQSASTADDQGKSAEAQDLEDEAKSDEGKDPDASGESQPASGEGASEAAQDPHAGDDADGQDGQGPEGGKAATDPAQEGAESGEFADPAESAESAEAQDPDASKAGADKPQADPASKAAVKDEAANEANKDKAKRKAAALKAQADSSHPGVIEVISDEGSKVRYHITSGSTVELGTGEAPSKDYTTIDYSFNGTLTIPETVTCDGVEYKVTGIAAGALGSYYVSRTRYGSRVSRVIIPETVTAIGDSAFDYTTSLRSISIPDSVTSLGAGAFRDSRLSSVEFTGACTLGSIPDNCFFGTGIADIDFIPASVTALGNYAFSHSSVENAVVPAQISAMGRGVFAGCAQLKHAEFAGTPPNNEIPAHTFSGCKSLSSFDFANGVSSIESYAFSQTGFSRVTMPRTVTYLGDYAFAACEGLVSFTFEEGHGLLDVSEGLFSKCAHLRSVELPQTVRTIGAKAFSGCERIESLDLPPSLRSLGDFALESCTSLATVTFQGDATYVDSSSSTFYLANALTSVVFLGKKATTLMYPSAMPTIYYTVSYYLSQDAIGVQEPYARHIVAANAVPSKATDEQTFEGAYLSKAPSGATWAYEDGFGPTAEIVDSYYAYVPGASRALAVGDTFVANTVEGVPVTYTVTAKAEGTQPGTAKVGWATDTGSQQAVDANTTGAVTLPQRVVASDGKTYEVSAIEGYSFLNCRRIVSVTIPSTVKSIGLRAFSRCSQLRNIYFESDAQTIVDDGIFAGCGSIEHVIFGGKKANLSFGTSSPDVYYTVFYYESKHDRDIDNRQSTLVVHERARLGSLKKAEIYSGSIPGLKTGFEWSYEKGFGADIPLVDSTKVYAAGVGFQYQVQVVDGNVDRTDCWFKVLTFDEKTGTGTCMVGLGKDGICAVHTGVSGMPVIPQAVTDQDGNVFKVTEVSDYAFGSDSYWQACHYLTSVSLPGSVTAIGAGAFQNCQLMERISVPAAVKTLGKAAFMGCSELASATFESGCVLGAIPASCFEGDEKLKSLKIPDGVTSIGARAFADCYGEKNNGSTRWGIESVSLPASVKTIGEAAFQNDGCLKVIDIPASCTHVGANAFRGCWDAGLIRFNGNAAKTTFGDGAFDVRYFSHDNHLTALIFMDKKSAVAADYISVADSWGDPQLPPTTYYCIRFYNSQAEFSADRVASRLLIKDDVAAIHYADGCFSGSYPRPADKHTWRCEDGFAVNKRTADSYYAVLGRDLSYASVKVSPADYFYTGGYITPEPVVAWADGTVLKKGVDYVLDTSKGQFHDGYTNNRHGPEARVFVLGKGDYAGGTSGAFNISLQTDSKDSFTVDLADRMLYVYDGSPKKPKVVVNATLAGEPYDAVEGEDYEVHYRNNTDAGVGKVVVRGKGVFGGEYVMPFTIHPMSILKCTVTGLKGSYTLEKGHANPTVQLANPQGVPLVEGVDYEVTYSNNSTSGVGTLRIVGLGNYSGVMSKSFTVVGSGNGKGNGNGKGKGSGHGTGTGTGRGKGQGAQNANAAAGTARANAAANSSGDVAPASAETASAEGGSDGGSGFDVFRIGSKQPDLVVTVQEDWWWIAIVIFAAGLIAAGMANQRRLFVVQKRKSSAQART